MSEPPVVQEPPVVIVSYNPESKTISANPNVLEVGKGAFILTWIKADPNALWEFTGLEIKGPKGSCFQLPTIRPTTMSIVDNNSDSSCTGKIRYTITIEHPEAGKVTHDPEIENKPQG